MMPGIDKEAEVLLVKAAEDETAAKIPGMPDGPFGFHIQQAVEKLLKALLCQRVIKYKFVHDLEYLAKLLRDNGESIPKGAVDIAELERYGVAYRCDTVPEIEILDRTGAIETVRILREHVLGRIAALSGAP